MDYYNYILMSKQQKQEQKVDISQSQFQFQEQQTPVEKADQQQQENNQSIKNVHNQSQPQKQQSSEKLAQQSEEQEQQYNFDEPVAEEISSISNKSSEKENDANHIYSNDHRISQQPQFSQQSDQIEENSDMQYPSLTHEFQSSELKPAHFSSNQAQQKKNQTQQIKQLQSVQRNEKKLQKSIQQKPNKEADNQIIYDNKALIQLAQNEELAQIKLQQAEKYQKPTQIKFLEYKVEYFLKIQTQIFVLSVHNPQDDTEPYIINRRFSDFLFLFESITINHLGYILYPFPQKNLDTFIKLKLNLSIQNEGQKIQLIEQRMLELQKFTNFILNHRQLRNSDQIKIFLSIDEIFQKDRKRIQSFVQQYKQLESHSNFKNIVDKSFNFLTSYLRKNSEEKSKTQAITKKDIQFGIYLQNIQRYIDKLTTMMEIVQQLIKIEKQFSEFVDIQTDIDLLLRLCAKHSSGKQFTKYFAKWIENELLQKLIFRLRDLKQIQAQLLYRIQLQQIAKDIAGKSESKEQQGKLKRRISRFEANFRSSWAYFFSSFKKDYDQFGNIFKQAWLDYQNKMAKIWKEQ